MNPAFLQEALALAQSGMNSNSGGPFGAVVVKNGEIVGRGWNQVTSINDPTAHAEIVAIRQAAAFLRNFRLSGCEIYASSEPCPMCLSAIYWARIERVYYAGSCKDAAAAGFDDDFIRRELLLPFAARQLPLEQHLREEAVKLFDQWRQKGDKVPY